MIFVGFFPCGYQLGFITAHFPGHDYRNVRPDQPDGYAGKPWHHHHLGAGAGHLIDRDGEYRGSILSGWLGKRFTKKYLLAGIYTLRTIASATFILMPITPTSVIVFHWSWAACGWRRCR